jgi:hypothetical protein
MNAHKVLGLKVAMLVLAAAALIAFPAANAIADESKDDAVVIVKCEENNTAGAPIAPTVLIAQASSGFTLPASCDPAGGSCANCLRDLISNPVFDCEGDEEFTSNVVVEQQSTTADPRSINKFVFACGLP